MAFLQTARIIGPDDDVIKENYLEAHPLQLRQNAPRAQHPDALVMTQMSVAEECLRLLDQQEQNEA